MTDYLPIDGSKPMTGNFDVGGHNIKNLGAILDSFELGDGLNDMLILPKVDASVKKVYLGSAAKKIYSANIYALTVTLLSGLISLPFDTTNASIKTKQAVGGNITFYTNGLVNLLKIMDGHIYMANLPAVDPADGTGKLWKDANGFVKVGS